ncbi:MAG: NUDIX hydrolase [Candidatus Pacebacteria bacterium]|nr:NUDIX hydrolase [Candidatus Paceibacterota bacterium]
MNNLFQINSSVIILNSKNEVLLAKRSKTEDVHPGLWCIPGGKLENTDSCLEDGLRREVREEIGIEISDIILIKDDLNCSLDVDKLYLIFSAKHSSGDPQPLDSTDKVVWFNAENLPNENEFTPRTRDIILNILK